MSDGQATIDALLGLRVGEAVEVRGHLYHVRGTLIMTERRRVWREHYLDDRTGDQRWLAVETSLVTLWSEPDDMRGLPAEADPDKLPDLPTLQIDGISYARTDSGTATYRVDGATPFAETGWVEFADYRAADGRHLSLELFDGGSLELSRGEEVQPESLKIILS